MTIPRIFMLLIAGLVSRPDVVHGQTQGPDRGFYVGGALGRSSAELGDTENLRQGLVADGFTVGDFSIDEKGTAWKAFIGYQINRNLAAEFAYVNLADFSLSMPLSLGGLAATGTVKWEPKETFTLSALGILPFGDRFSAFAKLGGYMNKLERTISVSAGAVTASVKESARSTGLLWGLGVGFDINADFTIRGEWERLLKVGKEGKTGEGDIDMLTIGAIYRFR